MFGNRFGGFAAYVPPVTKNLIIINVIIWVAEALFPKLGETIISCLGLHYIGASDFNILQPITYLFVHDRSSVFHVLFNMFTLWMFGSMLERIWGSRRFLIFYFVCGIGAALVQELVWTATWADNFSAMQYAFHDSGINIERAEAMLKNSMVTIGASGAVFGIIMGFAFVFPDRPLYLFFIPVPIKAKYMMIGYGVIEFFLGIADADMVAHFAHLGGMLFGLGVLLYWKKKGMLRGGGFY